MMETFVDPETGWTVARETVGKNDSGEELVKETITNPYTGAQALTVSRASNLMDISKWIRDVADLFKEQMELEQQRMKHLHRMYPELAAGAEVPAGPLGRIKLRFAEQFAVWDICLPEDDVTMRRQGKIVKARWTIWYLFGSDEKGEYLDYYASGPTVSDEHVRIYSDGQPKALPTIRESRVVSEDPQEDARLEADYYAYNQRVAAMLETKGFGLEGNEPSIMQVNRFLHLQPTDADSSLLSSITPAVASRLGYYVYLYIDPRTGKPFYVGKGQGQRVLSHLTAEGESRKTLLLQELGEQGLEPHIDILAHALPDEETALRIEASVIDLLGLDGLSNEVRGWRSIQLGRIPLKELVVYYAATPVNIDDPVLLIRINRLYRHGMSPTELYEATRGVWKLSERRKNARFAFAVFEGVVREVYEIHSWHLAGTTHYTTRPREDVAIPGRWEFLGEKASDEIRSKYVDHLVKKYLAAKAQNPVVYVNA